MVDGTCYQDNHLYRRHVDTGQFQAGSFPAPGSTGVPPRGTGLHHQSGEINPIPSAGDRISGTNGGLVDHPIKASWRQAATNLQVSC